MRDPHRQDGYGVRLEWGPVGAQRLAPSVAISVVIDVLSFSTTVSVAADRGVAVFPLPWDEPSAQSYADRLGATLAVGRSATRPGVVTLSPVSLRQPDAPERVVLPSPNGSAICHGLAAAGAEVLVGCLRNRRAVARALDPALAAEHAVLLVPAGERWPDDSLRPAVEDLWGAGGIAAALEDLGRRDLSEEARAAAASYRRVEHRLRDALLSCSSGRELADHGFAADVEIAAELDESVLVPRLGGDGGLTAGPRAEGRTS